MRCNKIVVPDKSKPKRVTYCQDELGHTGPCSIERPKVPAAAPLVIRRDKLGLCAPGSHEKAYQPHVRNDACYNWRAL